MWVGFEPFAVLGIPERHVAPTLAPWRRRGLLFAPTKGLWGRLPYGRLRRSGYRGWSSAGAVTVGVAGSGWLVL